jgi:hypothetical protein
LPRFPVTAGRSAGADDVAAGPLALEALSEPEQRRAATVELGRLLDQAGRNARRVLTPLRGAAREERLELLPADCMSADEIEVDKTFANDHVE